MMKKFIFAVAFFSLCLAVFSTTGRAVEVDPGIKPYAKVGGVSGNLNSIGSDTMNNLMTFWAEGFNRLYPNVKVQIEGKGSSTAPPALIMGTAQIGPMSRAMKPTEIDNFERRYGYKPTQIRKFFDEVQRFESMLKAKPSEFDNILPYIKMLNAKVAYAAGRNLVSLRFKDFISGSLAQIKDRDDFYAFAGLFEAFMGYYKFYRPSEGGGR